MADNEKGGLSSVDPMASFSQKLQAQTTESQRVLDDHRKRLMDLMSSRQQMPFDPAMMSLAAGLLSPTKTGGFGESLAAGMTGYATETEKQFRRQQEEAKLGYELEMAAQDQKRKMMGQQFFGELASRKKTTLAPSSATATSAEAPAVVPAAATSDASNAPPVIRADASIRPEIAQAPSKEAPSAPSSPSQVLAQVNKNDQQIRNLLGKIQTSGSDAFADISNEEIAMLEMYSPEYAKMINSYRDAVNKGTTLDVSRLRAFIDASKLELDKVQETRNQAEFELKKKESGFKEREVGAKEESIKRNLPGVGAVEMPLKFWNALDKAESFDDIQNVYKKFNMPLNTTIGTDGQLRFMTPSEIELKNKKDEARFTQTPIKRQIPEYAPGTFDISPVDFADYRTARNLGPNALQHWFNGSQFSGVKIPNATIGTSINSVPQRSDQQPSTGRVQSAEELEVETTAKKKRAEEEVKADVEFGNNIMKEGTNAQNIRIIAKDLKSISTSNPKILDVMQDTTVSDALARTIQTGVITPWGSVSIDPKDLYVAVDNYTKGKAGITKADRDAYSLFLRNIAQLTVLERRMSRGEGAISDKETGLFQQVNVLSSDSALAVRLKAELIEERANVTEKIGDAFYKFKKKTSGSYEDFTHSDEFKSIKNNYESRLDRIRDSNAKLLGGVSTPSSQSVPQTELPAAAKARLAEGQITTFNNGQQWTLKNGKPVRIK
jgi:hypothetical protein